MIALLSLVLPALAGDCAPLLEVEALDLVEAQYEEILGVDLPDVAEHDRLSRQFETRLTCAEFPLDVALWSRYLVSVAIREYFRGGNWRAPLTTALRIDPEVEIPVRPGHPLRDFSPPPTPAPIRPLPEGVTLRLDGTWTDEEVHLDAIHLLQRHEGDEMLTAVVYGPATLPREFLARPKPPRHVRQERRRRRIHLWGTAGAMTLLMGGAAAEIHAFSLHGELTDPATPESAYPDLVRRGAGAERLGVALLSGSAATLGVVWAVPW